MPDVFNELKNLVKNAAIDRSGPPKLNTHSKK